MSKVVVFGKEIHFGLNQFQTTKGFSSTMSNIFKNRWTIRTTAIISVFALSFYSYVPANADRETPKVEICHATNSNSNPYNSANASETADAGGHNGHNGPVWFDGITQQWGDIIPPFNNGNIHYPGKNWTASGQDIWNNGKCDGDGITTGNLTVTKNTGNANNNATFTFNVYKTSDVDYTPGHIQPKPGKSPVATHSFATVGGTGSYTFTNLSPNTYSVIESTLPANWGFDNASSTCDNGISVTQSHTSSCTMVNYYVPPAPGSLTVNKVTVNGDGTFNFTGTGSIGDFAITTELNGGSSTFELAPGTYSVTEGSLALGWVQTSNDCSEVTVSSGEKSSCTITNTYTAPKPEKGNLTLIKEVVGGNSSASAWTLSADGETPLSGTTPVSGQVVPGNYTLSESSGPDNYSASGWDCVLTTEAGPQAASMDGNIVTVGANQDITCTITNRYSPPSPTTATVTLIKQLAGNGEALATDWTLSASNQGDSISGTTPVSGQLDPGTYTLSESEGPSGYYASDWSCFVTDSETPVTVTTQESGDQTITVQAGDDVTCTIVNTYRSSTPTYSISGKIYKDDNQNNQYDDGENGLQGWRAYIDLPGEGEQQTGNNEYDPGELTALSDSNGDYTITDVPAGCYTVREVPQASWNQTEPDVTEHEYTNVSVGFANCTPNLSFLQKVSNFLIPTAQAASIVSGNAVGKNFGNYNVPTTGGGGGGGGSYPYGSISGTIYVDANANGTYDAGDTTIPGVTVYFDGNSNGVFDPGEVNVTSNGSGQFQFNNLIAGTYNVREVTPGGYTVTEPTPTLVYVVASANNIISEKNFGHKAVGRVLGDTTDIPSNSNPQVLGATTELPRTGTPLSAYLMVFAILGILLIPAAQERLTTED